MKVNPNKLWHTHLPPDTLDVSEPHLLQFFTLMHERQEIWWRRNKLNQQPPWTKDPILANYKFTNVYRELDRASQWLIQNVLLDTKNTLEDLLFKILVFRFYNQAETFTGKHAVQMPHYKTFDSEWLWAQTVQYRELVGNPWSSAYFKNPMGYAPPGWNKPGKLRDDVYCNTVIKKAHSLIPQLAYAFRTSSNPKKFIDLFEQIPTVGTFLSHEFYVDFCYITKYTKFNFKCDEDDFTNVGPGASVGLRLIFPSLKPKDQMEGIYWLRDLAPEYLQKVSPGNSNNFKYLYWEPDTKSYFCSMSHPNITLHQCEMTLCEYAKYFKMKVGDGKQRSKYIPKQ
jgi:hypothetical protein